MNINLSGYSLQNAEKIINRMKIKAVKTVNAKWMR